MRQDEDQLGAQPGIELRPCRHRHDLPRIDAADRRVTAGVHVGAVQCPRLVADRVVELMDRRLGLRRVGEQHEVPVELASQFGSSRQRRVHRPDAFALGRGERSLEQCVEVEVEHPRVGMGEQRRAVDEEAGEPVAEDLFEAPTKRRGHRLDRVGEWHAADARGALRLD